MKDPTFEANLPPDVNRAELDFLPEGRAIITGLSFIRTLPHHTMERTLEEREKARRVKSGE